MPRSSFRFIWFLVILTALLSIDLVAQTHSPLNTKHQFDKQKLDALRKDMDYQYDEVSAELSTWQKIKQTVREWLGSLIDTQQKQDVWSWVLTIFSGLVLFVVLMRLAGADKYFLFVKKAKGNENSTFSEQFEQFDEADLEQKIQEALEMQNYTMATRWFYLRSLKVLQSRQWIDWQKNKTNQTYLTELKQNKPLLGDAFQKLTLWFEYVYYGDFDVKSIDFEDIKMSFEEFQQKILTIK